MKMFESRISAGATEKLLGCEKPHAKTVSSPVTWKVMLKSALKDIVSWRIKRRSNCTKFQPLAWMITTSSRRNWSQSENFIRSMFSMVLKCLYLARAGRPDILWSGNKLARAVTKWTRACDRRLALLISYIHYTKDHRQYCHVGNTAQHCRLGLFQDSDFAGGLEDFSKSTSRGILCICGSRTFVLISWMCKRQTSVSHSSTETEIISLDAGLRMDGVPVLVHVVIDALHTSEKKQQHTTNPK